MGARKDAEKLLREQIRALIVEELYGSGDFTGKSASVAARAAELIREQARTAGQLAGIQRQVNALKARDEDFFMPSDDEIKQALGAWASQ
jgi:hypothetical protein